MTFPESPISQAHFGNIEAIRDDIRQHTQQELVEKYRVSMHTVVNWERRYEAYCKRFCQKHRGFVSASQFDPGVYRRFRGRCRATATESRHLDMVAALPCALCEALGSREPTDVTVHHIREGQGLSQRANHFLTIPLCYFCHQGPQGIHGDRSLWKIAKVDELDLLAWTIEQLERRA